MNVTFSDLAERSISWNGYEREAAIKGLLAIKDPRAIPLLIHRVNDWVKPVQQLAENSLLTFLRWYPNIFLGYLPQIIKLRQKRRWNHNDLVNSITKMLVEVAPNELLASITSDDSKLALIAFKICVEHKLATADQLIDRAMSNSQLHNAHYLIALIEQLDDKPFEALADKLLATCYLPLKNKVIKRLNVVNPEKIASIAETLMCNREETVRHIGRKHLALSDVDTINYYKSILEDSSSNSNRKIIAICELTALQKMEALPTLYRFLEHPAPKIRKFVLQQLTNLQGEQVKPIFIEALTDPQATVVREIARLCRQNSILFNDAEILLLATRINREQTLDSLLLISKLQDKWRRIILCLRLLLIYQHEEASVTHIRYAVEDWLYSVRHGSGSIPRETLAELNTLVSATREGLTPYQYKVLRFMIETDI